MTEQHTRALQALQLANQSRIDAATVRREVREGSLAIEDAFSDDRAGPLTCERLLRAQRQWGAWRTTRFLNRCQLAPSKKVRSLTASQVDRIKQLLNDPIALKDVFYF